MSEEKIELIVPEEYHLERIDKFLVHALEIDLSRSYIQKLIKNSNIIVNNIEIRSNYKIKADDIIIINIPEPEKLNLEAQDIPIEIVYQDKSIAVINKQPSLVVHPGPGNWDRTLVNALLYHLKDLSSIGGTARPGIVHRLDKDTSGLIVIAKNDLAHRHLVSEFSNRRVNKRYKAVVIGKPKKKHEIINLPIARHKKYGHKMTVTEEGKEAITEYNLEKTWNLQTGIFSMLDIKIHTGRSHQIRVHLSAMGNPIVGDPIYSKKWQKYRVPYLLLASTSLGFAHPDDKREVKFEADLPEHIADYIRKLQIKVL